MRRAREYLSELGVEMTPDEYAAKHRDAAARIRATLARLKLPVVESCMEGSASLKVINDAIKHKDEA